MASWSWCMPCQWVKNTKADTNLDLNIRAVFDWVGRANGPTYTVSILSSSSLRFYSIIFHPKVPMFFLADNHGLGRTHTIPLCQLQLTLLVKLKFDSRVPRWSCQDMPRAARRIDIHREHLPSRMLLAIQCPILLVHWSNEISRSSDLIPVHTWCI